MHLHSIRIIWILICFLCLGKAFSSIPESRKCIIYDQEGWKCNDGSCIEKEWICDKNNQCENDNSDEEEGCNLFPETQCKSWNGEKYVRCPSSSKCVAFKDKSQVEKECANSVDLISVKPSDADSEQSIPSTCSNSKWRCTDGLCITLSTVCDGKKDCDDGSDEEKGCHMYGKECKSWNGKMHVKCRVPEELSFSDSFVCTLPAYNEKNNSSSCRKCEDENNWRCDDGYCIPKEKYRDGIPHCEDGSDEKPVHLRLWKGVVITMALTAGGICLSFFYRFFVGKKDLRDDCPGCKEDKVEHAAEKTVMKGDFGRKNEDANIIESQNCNSSGNDTVDHSRLCQPSRDEMVPSSSNFEKPEEINLSIDVLPMELIQLLENPENWSRKASCNKIKIQREKEDSFQHLYAKIHQVPRLYRNLYYYFYLRCDSLKSLHKFTSKFHAWEMEFHNEEPLEVLKCWRLHLGSCEILKSVIQSFEKPGICDQMGTRCLPIRNALRNLRFTKQVPNNNQKSRWKENKALDVLYTIFKRVWYSIKPFLGASTLYVDVFKDTSIAILIYSTLNSMSNENLLDPNYQFETTLFAVLVSSIIFVQLCWIAISCYYAEDIFSICKHWNPSLRFGFRINAILLGPMMPAFVLANHVYYNERSHSLTRDLQTLGKQKYDLMFAVSHVMATNETLDDLEDPVDCVNYERSSDEHIEIRNDTTNETKPTDVPSGQTNNDYEQKDGQPENGLFKEFKDEREYDEWLRKEKEQLFKSIVAAEFQAKYFRRIYSFYRIVTAVIESYCVITVLVLFLIVSGRNEEFLNLIGSDSKSFISVLEVKLANFIGIDKSHDSQPGKMSFIETVQLVRTVVFWGSISYSAFMLLSALVRYVYQSKSENVSIMGQICLGLYFLCHLVTRLILTIAIFATAEANPVDYSQKSPVAVLPEENPVDDKGPVVSKLPASISILILFILHFGFIYFYKHKFIREFREETNDFIERIVHVLANTLVVIPFMTWDVEGPSSIEYQGTGTFHDCLKKTKTGSLDDIVKVMSMVKISNKWSNLSIKRSRQKGHRKTLSAGNIVKADYEFPDVLSPLTMQIGNVREKIESLWWENPSRKLTLYDVKNELPAKTKLTVPDDVIEKAFKYLVSEGFINKRLYNPRRTKREYFWLLLIHLFINLVAFSIEIINGGVKTPKGMYVSWDVRLVSFLMGLIFLILYYKRYHVLKDLTRVPVCGCGYEYCPIFCCIRKDAPMQAIPDDEEMQRHLSPAKSLNDETKSKTIETQTSHISTHQVENEHFVSNGVNTNQRSANGIKQNILNQFQKLKRKSPRSSEERELDKKNMECQTDMNTIPEKTNDSTNVEQAVQSTDDNQTITVERA